MEIRDYGRGFPGTPGKFQTSGDGVGSASLESASGLRRSGWQARPFFNFRGYNLRISLRITSAREPFEFLLLARTELAMQTPANVRYACGPAQESGFTGGSVISTRPGIGANTAYSRLSCAALRSPGAKNHRQLVTFCFATDGKGPLTTRIVLPSTVGLSHTQRAKPQLRTRTSTGMRYTAGFVCRIHLNNEAPCNFLVLMTKTI